MVLLLHSQPRQVVLQQSQMQGAEQLQTGQVQLGVLVKKKKKYLKAFKKAAQNISVQILENYILQLSNYYLSFNIGKVKTNLV